MEYLFLGERELVLGFMLAGVEGKAISNRTEALDAFLEATGQAKKDTAVLNSRKPKVLIVTEDVSDMISKEILDWQLKGCAPLIVEIPGLGGHIQGRKTLTDSIREAVGIQI